MDKLDAIFLILGLFMFLGAVTIPLMGYNLLVHSDPTNSIIVAANLTVFIVSFIIAFFLILFGMMLIGIALDIC